MMRDTNTTTVVNLRDGKKYDIYIGRTRAGTKRTILGNGHHITPICDRNEAVRRFAVDFPIKLRTEPDFAKAVERARGKRLGCFCDPLPCHGHVYVIYHEQGLAGVSRVAHGEPVLDVLNDKETSHEQ